MTIQEVLDDFTDKFGKVDLEDQYKIMIMWLYFQAVRYDKKAIFITNAKSLKRIKNSHLDSSNHATILAELDGNPIEEQVRIIIEEKIRAEKNYNESVLEKSILAKPFGILTKKLKALKSKLKPKNLVEYKAFLDSLIQKMQEKKVEISKYQFTKTPSRVIKDFRWALANFITHNPDEDLCNPNGEIRNLEQLIRFSKNTSLRQLHDNINAIDYLLGLNSAERAVLPPYILEQLNTILYLTEMAAPTIDENDLPPVRVQVKREDVSKCNTREVLDFLRQYPNFEELRHFIISMKEKLTDLRKTLAKEGKSDNRADDPDIIAQDIQVLKALFTRELEEVRRQASVQEISSRAVSASAALATRSTAPAHKNKSKFSGLLSQCFASNSHIQKYEEFIEKVTLASHDIFNKLSGPEDNFMKACEYEAVNALITGDLHRLDPVNGDASCQFRVPFVADLYTAVMADFNKNELVAASNEYGENAFCLQKFMKKTSQNFIAPSEAKKKSIEFKKEMNKKLSSKVTKFDWKIEFLEDEDSHPVFDLDRVPTFAKMYLAIVQKIRNLDLTQMTGFSNVDDMPLGDVWKSVNGIPASYMTTVFERVYFGETSTLRYLTLCRALTVKRLAMYDDFYIQSHVSTLEFPAMAEVYMQEIYVELAWYSSAYIKVIFSVMTDVPYDEYFQEEVEDLDYLQFADKEPRFLLDMNIEDFQPQSTADDLNEGLQSTEWYYTPKTAAGSVIAYYENKRLLYMYLFIRRMPIIVDLRRVIATENGDDYSYQYSGGGVYYFEPCLETKRYIYVPDGELTHDQKQAQGLCIEGYSMMIDGEGNEALPDFAYEKNYKKFEAAWLTQTDLIDQILITTMSHPAATGSTKRRSNDTTHYMRVMRQTKDGLVNFSEESKANDFIKLTVDDAVSLYAQQQHGSTGKTGAGETPAQDLYLSDEYTDFGNPELELTGQRRGYLPIFANLYNGKEWDMLKERALIAAISDQVGYKGYVYSQEVKGDAKNVTITYRRNAVTYLLTCRHLYVSSFAKKTEHFEKYCKISNNPKAKDQKETRFFRADEGTDACYFMA